MNDWQRISDMPPGPDSPTLEPEFHAALRRWMQQNPVRREDLLPSVARQFDELARATYSCDVAVARVLDGGRALVLLEPRGGQGYPYVVLLAGDPAGLH